MHIIKKRRKIRITIENGLHFRKRHAVQNLNRCCQTADSAATSAIDHRRHSRHPRLCFGLSPTLSEEDTDAVFPVETCSCRTFLCHLRRSLRLLPGECRPSLTSAVALHSAGRYPLVSLAGSRLLKRRRSPPRTLHLLLGLTSDPVLVI